ncbi:hypothetical protein ACLOJK_001485 [Asimina triloba]
MRLWVAATFARAEASNGEGRGGLPIEEMMREREGLWEDDGKEAQGGKMRAGNGDRREERERPRRERESRCGNQGCAREPRQQDGTARALVSSPRDGFVKFPYRFEINGRTLASMRQTLRIITHHPAEF